MRGTDTLERGLTLLELVVNDGGESPVSDLGRRSGLALPTVRRLIRSLVLRGYVTRVGYGRYAAGDSLVPLAGLAHPHKLLASRLRAPLRGLARRLGATMHLGVLDADMVTYLVKEEGGNAQLFTREGGQLEAYCSAIGKVLLAHLEASAREAYLAGGPFVPLTDRTIVDADLIREELLKVRARGHATDVGEVAQGLYCVAVPVEVSGVPIPAAVSASFTTPLRVERIAKVLAALDAAPGISRPSVGRKCEP